MGPGKGWDIITNRYLWGAAEGTMVKGAKEGGKGGTFEIWAEGAILNEMWSVIKEIGELYLTARPILRLARDSKATADGG